MGERGSSGLLESRIMFVTADPAIKTDHDTNPAPASNDKLQDVVETKEESKKLAGTSTTTPQIMICQVR